MTIDPWILAFSAVTVVTTIWLGFWSAKKSRTASDFFVAGRSVSVGWNASAISGEYLSAASFMGIAGMVMSSGYDALWYPVCYACGYLFLLLFIAGPLRRFGAYTIPDFAEGRFDSPVFRKIAVVFVLFIGFFYTMPQMKGAGTTLAYIFPGLPYWVGVAVVGAVITLNVALGGMKGITLVQAFQYWAKMFAISVPIFVLMSVYGSYGRQLGLNGGEPVSRNRVEAVHVGLMPDGSGRFPDQNRYVADGGMRRDFPFWKNLWVDFRGKERRMEVSYPAKTYSLPDLLNMYTQSHVWHRGVTKVSGVVATELAGRQISYSQPRPLDRGEFDDHLKGVLATNGITLVHLTREFFKVVPTARAAEYGVEFRELAPMADRAPLPPKAPTDAAWLNPFGPLTTKAAKAAAAALTNSSANKLSLRPGLTPETKMTVNMSETNVTRALVMYAELTGRTLLPRTRPLVERVDGFFGGWLARWGWIKVAPRPESGVFVHGDGLFSAVQVREHLEAIFRANGLVVVPEGTEYLRTVTGVAGGDSTAARQKAWLAKHEKRLALLYTYSLIIALVCGTAGLPHILVRFYTNPDGVAAKRTTMWVMILIGVFYVFPPIFGVMGRNLMPELYKGTGAKGTDKVVLELPRILNPGEQNSRKSNFDPATGGGSGAASVSQPVSTNDADARSASADPVGRVGSTESRPPGGIPWGSILSGITCAGAFAAFMSTFSGLLVSMTGALAHDVYGRMLRPKSTPDERMRMFKIGAVIIGGVAILLGTQVEKLEINFMVGQAFAIAAASYFPLLFVSVWWRGLTVKGAAAGMLTGGLMAVLAISLTSFTTLGWLQWDGFWAAHPLLRILCDQPAIWTVPLAIILMVVISKLTRNDVPADIRQKMLVLHAPEKLGLKQEYIQEHQHGH